MGVGVLTFILVVYVGVCAGVHMRAHFDQADVRGYVQLGQTSASSTNLVITFDLRKGLRSDFNTMTFKITSNPSGQLFLS